MSPQTTVIFIATGLRRRATVHHDGDRFEANLQTRIRARWMFSAMVRSADKHYAVRRACEWVSEEPAT